MLAPLAACALAALAPLPDVSLEVRGDDALAAWLSARAHDAWGAAPRAAGAPARFVVRVARLDEARVHVDVLEGPDVLLARDVEGAPDDVLYARTWLVVRSTVERARTELAPPSPRAPADAPPIAVAPARVDDAGRFGLSLAGRAVIDAGAAPAGAVAGASWTSALADIPVHARVDAGYTYRGAGALSVHAAPLGLAAFLRTASGDASDVALGVGLRAGAAVTVASLDTASDARVDRDAAKRATTAWGVTAGAGPAVRVDVRIAGTSLVAFAEAALEARVVRQAWRLDDGVVEDALVAAPLFAGVEWRFGGAP